MSAQASEGINPQSKADAVCSIHHISIGDLKQGELYSQPGKRMSVKWDATRRTEFLAATS